MDRILPDSIKGLELLKLLQYTKVYKDIPDMKQLYEAIIMDHYRHPRYRGTLDKPDFSSHEHNPSCGDSVSFQGHIVDGVITELAFMGAGCVISQAAASLIAQELRGAQVPTALAYEVQSVLSLIGMPTIGPTRLRCALLGLEALQAGLRNYEAP
jgi:nitrogen fixation NifU-like protein